MGYFDSPKNKALWNKELSRLRQEREARKRGEPSESVETRKEQMREAEGPKKERVTYQQLLAEEQGEKKNRLESRRGMVRRKEKEMTAETPER